jgi:hypothetical protein
MATYRVVPFVASIHLNEGSNQPQLNWKHANSEITSCSQVVVGTGVFSRRGLGGYASSVRPVQRTFTEWRSYGERARPFARCASAAMAASSRPMW